MSVCSSRSESLGLSRTGSRLECVSDKALCSFSVHRRQFRSSDPLCSLHDSLESPPLCLCCVSRPVLLVPYRPGQRAVARTSLPQQPDAG